MITIQETFGFENGKRYDHRVTVYYCDWAEAWQLQIWSRRNGDDPAPWKCRGGAMIPEIEIRDCERFVRSDWDQWPLVVEVFNAIGRKIDAEERRQQWQATMN